MNLQGQSEIVVCSTDPTRFNIFLILAVRVSF